MSSRFAEDWSLSFDNLLFLADLSEELRLETALQLCALRCTGRFLEDWSEVPEEALSYVASQVEQPEKLPCRGFDDRTARRCREKIINHLKLSRPSSKCMAAFDKYVLTAAGASGPAIFDEIDQSCCWFRDHGLVSPPANILVRRLNSTRQQFLRDYLKTVAMALSFETRLALEASLSAPRGEHGFLRLKEDVGAATLDSVLDATSRLEFVQSLDLPFDLMVSVHPSWVKTLVRRVEGETASEMRRHGETKRLGLLAIYIMSRRAQLLDGLVDLLIELVHRIGAKSRRKVINRIAADIGKVHGKERLLVDIATAAMEMPDGKVADVIYPVAGAARLKAIIDEHRAKGTLDTRIQTVMRGSLCQSLPTHAASAFVRSGVSIKQRNVAAGSGCSCPGQEPE